MKFYQLSALILTASLLGACATSTPQWYKEGVSAYETNNQLNKCQYDINMARDVKPMQEEKMVHHCMKKEGFRWVYR